MDLIDSKDGHPVGPKAREHARIRTWHVLAGCPYCLGEKSFGTEHWMCPNKEADWYGGVYPWYHAGPPDVSECPCGGSCYEERVPHG